MRRKPRDPNAPLFSSGMIAWSICQGVFAFAIVAAIYVVALNRGISEDEARALTFFAPVISIVALIFVNRSPGASLARAFLRSNPALMIALPIVAAMLAVTLLWRHVPVRAAPCRRTFADGRRGLLRSRHAGIAEDALAIR
jgi:Ca2+-transporting ATPase